MFDLNTKAGLERLTALSLNPNILAFWGKVCFLCSLMNKVNSLLLREQ